jgi:hypothetical protein
MGTTFRLTQQPVLSPARRERDGVTKISGATRRFGVLVVAGALAAASLGALPVSASASSPGPTFESVCGPATPGTFQCLALRRTDVVAQPAVGVSPQAQPFGYGPADLRSAYALPAGSAGAGLTVAVVDAYDQASAESDLAAYRTMYGLPPCTTANGCFRKVNQRGVAGQPPAPATDQNLGWGQEIDLDIEMVAATCPSCNILLVEADSANTSDLAASVDTAVALGAIAVSNSYGGQEASGETSLDAHFNHPGVAITASTGDCGYDCTQGYGFPSVEYPAASPYVVAVGGTRLTKDSSARGWTETAWGDPTSKPVGGAGSGCSAFEPKPSWQTDSGCAMRTEADVSAVADPATGVAVNFDGGWAIFGGTSAASPIIASIFALAGGPPPGSTPVRFLYAASSSSFNDVVGGNNDVTYHTCTIAYLCNGVAGYDGPTGLGTPNGIAGFQASGQPPVVAGTFHSLDPARILDTRNGTGGSAVPLSNHVARAFQVGGGTSGVPLNATAVTGNVTVTQQTRNGYLFVGPVPTNNPTSSTLNFPVGDDRANAVTVALGDGIRAAQGSLSVTYVGSGPGTAQVIFDVTGYFTPDTTGATYHAVNPSRVLDTRGGGGAAALSNHVSRTFQVAGASGGVPSGATAVTGNVTVTQQTRNGYLFVGPNPINNPTSSTLNFSVGDDRANAVTVALSDGSSAAVGSLSVTFVGSGPGTAQVIFDVTGYFTPDATGAKYVPLSPARILDTRNGTGGSSAPLSSHVARTFQVSGGSIPSTAVAATGNLTVTQQNRNGYFYAGPVPTNDPTSSTLNFPIGDDRANAVTVALGDGTTATLGSLSVTFVGSGPGTAHAIFDVTGYFTP